MGTVPTYHIVKKDFMHIIFSLVVVLAIIAIIYLLVNGLGVSELLPKAVTNVLVKLSATIIITAIPLALYDLVGIACFGKIAVGVFAVGLFIALKNPIYGKVKREYRKKFGVPTSKDEWICKKCGEVNPKINKECAVCGNISPDWAKEPAASEAWICKRCSKKNYLADKNCSTCGYPKDDTKYTEK